MKYIITESQYKDNEKIINLLRRTKEDWPLIDEIIEEGLDMDDPCDFRDDEHYLRRICMDSARTYIYHYIDESYGKSFNTLLQYFTKMFRDKFGRYILDFYYEKQEDC